MRAREFIKPIFEAESSPSYVSIGDSHAHAVAQMGGKNWLNLAVPGASSKGPHPKIQQMLGNISKIPKGSVVLVALGANDTANAMAALANGGKPRPAASIASDVASVVDRVKSQGPSKVIFLLFPNGPGRGPKGSGAEHYGGAYQDEVRAAIRSAVGVPIIDINGKPLTDGVHAGMSTYKEVANEVMNMAKPSANKETSRNDSKDQTANQESFVVDVPQGRRGPKIADVQKSLEALGIPLPKYGVDGIQGKETTGAIKMFQEKNGLKATGEADQQTVDKMNAMLKAKPEVLAKLKKSTNDDVKSIDYSRSREELAALTSNESTQKARVSAEKYLGRPMSDTEWDDLLRATSAEASNNSKEQAYVMGVILNRARDGHGKASANVTSVLYAPSQFQAVTGTRYDPGASSNFRRGPTDRQLANIVDGAINILPQVPTNLKYFTAASSEAYKAGTNIGFRDRMIAQGGQKIGGTIFAANVA